MNNSKTFRLFISSTFSDFKREREVLQAEVFPQIKEYASSKGYSFQPIDLRWGVSHEAQLDQKTLELCLDEVRSCKSYPHPNFLIMIGDRYGWIPLPYSIEDSEFEKIQNFYKNNDKKIHLTYKGEILKERWFGSTDKKGLKKLLDESENDFILLSAEQFVDKDDNKEKVKYIFHRDVYCSKLLSWYGLDYNEEPDSFIIKERKDEYEEYDIWVAEENALRKLLQDAVSELKKDSEKKLTVEEERKYLLSATEAEVEEGILPYIKLTKYQEELVQNNESLKIIDPEHIFGFFKNREKSIVNNDNYDKAQVFKNNIAEVLNAENILPINKDIPEDIYLEEFKQKVTAFLILQIDNQKEIVLSTLDKELQAQSYFTQQKRKNFLGQEGIRNIISHYIEDNNQQPLVISGSSGIGKSALMAKAIEEACGKYNLCNDTLNNEIKEKRKKVLYRFVGATPNSGSSKEILTSIFEELDKDIRSDIEKEQKQSDDLSLFTQETFEQFSYRIHDEIMSLKDEIVMFIDAIDQLSNDDQFLWLPNSLPSNVKIIISALNDKKYVEDSKYFQDLEKKIDNKKNNIKEIPEFNEPIKLLKTLLKKEGRTLQSDHEAYFLKQFNISKSPLYVSIAAQAIKNWKSNDYVEDNPENKNGQNQIIQTTQEGIIEEFIANLSKVYHHNPEFVQRVLGYIYASKDGLSENELLQLIATDKEFIKKVTPEEHHENYTGELPLVHWSRLYAQLKQFLSLKTQDGEELMYFFHREFEDVISKLANQKEEHEAIINAAQILIEENQDKPFNENRWGKLYTRLITEYMLKNKNKKNDFAQFISCLKQEEYLHDFIDFLTNVGFRWLMKGDIQKVISSQNITLSAIKNLIEKNDEAWVDSINPVYNNLAEAYKKDQKIEKAIELNEINFNLLKVSIIERPYQYMACFNNLSQLYVKNNNLPYAIYIQEEGEKVVKELYEDNQDWIEDYIRTRNTLADFYYKNNRLNDAISLQEKNLELTRNPSSQETIEDSLKAIVLSNLGSWYFEKHYFEKALNFKEESRKVQEYVYQKNPNIYNADIYIEILNALAQMYGKYGNKEKERAICIIYVNESKKLYLKNPDLWLAQYTKALGNLSLSSSIDEGINYISEAVSILEDAYKKDKNYWVEDYARAISNLSYFYDMQGKDSDAIKWRKKALVIRKKLYNLNPKSAYFAEDYWHTLDGMAFLYNKNKLHKCAIGFQTKCVKICTIFYNQDPGRWVEHHTNKLGNLGMYYSEDKQYEVARDILENNLTIVGEYYKKDSSYWADNITNLLYNLTRVYYGWNHLEDAIQVQGMHFSIQEKRLEQNPDVIEKYEKSKENLEYLQLEATKRLELLCKKDSKLWKLKLIESLENLCKFYQYIEEDGKLDKTIQKLNKMSTCK